jgi:hypothetical protein
MSFGAVNILTVSHKCDMPMPNYFVVFFFVLWTCQRCQAVSTVMQLTSTNIQSVPFIVVRVVDDGASNSRFEVSYSAPLSLESSDSIRCELEVRSGAVLICRSSFGGARPTAWPKHSEDPGKQRPLLFSFTVRREHLATSKFSITLDQPGFPGFDNYWFYLRDFVHDQ